MATSGTQQCLCRARHQAQCLHELDPHTTTPQWSLFKAVLCLYASSRIAGGHESLLGRCRCIQTWFWPFYFIAICQTRITTLLNPTLPCKALAGRLQRSALSLGQLNLPSGCSCYGIIKFPCSDALCERSHPFPTPSTVALGCCGSGREFLSPLKNVLPVPCSHFSVFPLPCPALQLSG